MIIAIVVVYEISPIFILACRKESNDQFLYAGIAFYLEIKRCRSIKRFFLGTNFERRRVGRWLAIADGIAETTKMQSWYCAFVFIMRFDDGNERWRALTFEGPNRNEMLRMRRGSALDAFAKCTNAL